MNRQAVASSLGYSCASIAMVLLNKALLSSYQVKQPLSLLAWQSGISALLLYAVKWAGLQKIEDLNIETAKKWLPTNLLFLGECMCLGVCFLSLRSPDFPLPPSHALHLLYIVRSVWAVDYVWYSSLCGCVGERLWL